MVKLSIPPLSTNTDISLDDRSFNLEHISDTLHTASEVPRISHKPAPLICSIHPYVYKIAFGFVILGLHSTNVIYNIQSSTKHLFTSAELARQ